MNAETLKNQHIRLELDRQVEKRNALIRERDSVNAQIAVVDHIIQALSASLPHRSSVEQPLNALDTAHSGEPSKSDTLALLKEFPTPEGHRIKDIVQIYADRGVTVFTRIVFRHIKALIEEGKVEQANAPAKRNRRYRIKNTPEGAATPSGVETGEDTTSPDDTDHI